MRRTSLLVCLLLGVSAGISEPDSLRNSWTLENDLIAATYAWYSSGEFRLASLKDKRTSQVWTAAPEAPAGLVYLDALRVKLRAQTAYGLPAVSFSAIEKNGRRLTVSLQPPETPVELVLEAEVYPGQPFVRQRHRVRNLDTDSQILTFASFLDASFEDRDQWFEGLHVNQWVTGGTKGNFEPLETDLGLAGGPLVVESGSAAQHCSWLALRDAFDHGLVVGWEFNGRAQVSARQDFETRSLTVSGVVLGLNQRLEPGQVFDSPWVFLGVFQGDWDEAGYRTQRFVESLLAAPLPDGQRFPFVAWDSWGYGDDIHEARLRQAADIAARLGVELFTVDLGWARAMGDWQSDPVKFPSGLRALSDYVHARGMKFGLHLPLLEADRSAPVLRQHPDWAASVSDGFYGALSLCPGHEPVKQWLVAEVVRLVREYNVDWILQDGVDMVKRCTRRVHTHNRLNSNYANSVHGIDEIVAAIRRETPDAHWENCESGGRMMTYRMVQDYATSIAPDDSNSLTTRQAIYGATFPFPPRYVDRYTGGATVSKFVLRSGMFGGPWILMQRITDWDENQIRTAAAEVALYKSLRLLIRDGQVFHLTPRPDGFRNEALQSYHAETDSSVIFVFRPQSRESTELVRPRGLRQDSQYRIRFQEAGTSFVASGRDLLENGIRVSLPRRNFSGIVYISRAED